MAMDLETVASHLRELDLNFQEHPQRDEIGLFFETRKYRNPEGSRSLLIVLQLWENGELLRVHCPNLFQLKKSKHRGKTLRFLYAICRRMKLAHFDFHEKTGEVSYSHEFPLEDGEITSQQLRRLIYAPVALAESNSKSIHKVLKTGKMKLPEPPRAQSDPPKGTFPPGELADLMKLAGGVEGLREILRERILREKKRK